MNVKIQRMNNALHMQAENEDGNLINLDGAEKIGGNRKGFRPMQLLLAGLGSCSAIDIITILTKQKQDLKDIMIDISAEREENKIPSLFKRINVHYTLTGVLNEIKVKKAVELSMDKYCSVARILEKTAEINYDFEIKNN